MAVNPSIKGYNTLFEKVNYLAEKYHVRQKLLFVSQSFFNSVLDVPGIIYNEETSLIIYSYEFIRKAQDKNKGCLIDTKYVYDANALSFFRVNSSNPALKGNVSFNVGFPTIIPTYIDDHKSLNTNDDYKDLNLLHPVYIKLEYDENSKAEGTVVRHNLKTEQEYNALSDNAKTDYVNSLLNDPIWIVLNVANYKYGYNLHMLIEHELTHIFYLADKRKRFIEESDLTVETDLIKEYQLTDDTLIKRLKDIEHTFNICKYYLSTQERQARISSIYSILISNSDVYKKYVTENPDKTDKEIVDYIFEQLCKRTNENYLHYVSLYNLLRYSNVKQSDLVYQLKTKEKLSYEKTLEVLHKVVSFKLMILKKLNKLNIAGISSEDVAYYICADKFSIEELEVVHVQIYDAIKPVIDKWLSDYIDYISKIKTYIFNMYVKPGKTDTIFS